MNKNTTSSPMNFHRVSAIALTTCVGLLAGISSAAPVATTNSKVLSKSPAAEVVSENIIRLSVRTTDVAQLKSLVQSIGLDSPGVTFGQQADIAGDVFSVNTPNFASAMRVQKLLASSSAVQAISLDHSYNLSNYFAPLADSPSAYRTTVKSSGNVGIGIRPMSASTQAPRGGSGDPQFDNGNQWHFTNTDATYGGHDNTILASIYTTLGLSGAGVVVGVSAPGLNVHLDIDHADLMTNYSTALSMIIDPVAFADSTDVTGWAGIVAAERDNSIAGQGIAPGATLATFRWAGPPLIEFEAYDWLTQDIDIKFYRTVFDYVFPGGVYNNGHVNDYVMTPLQNSIRFGRSGNGVVNVFGTGTSVRYFPLFPNTLLPDPYDYPPTGTSFSPIDELANRTNIVAIGVTNAYTDGDLTNIVANAFPVVPPYYVTGNSNHYPPALDRRSLIINTIAEDGHYDVYASQGTSVFASVYGGTNNLNIATTNVPRGVVTTAPGGGSFAEQPADGTAALTAGTTTGPAIASGIIALMLEANPRLSIRDIQHILFESIQDSTKAPDLKWPNFDTTRSYFIPRGNFGSGDRGFWEMNSGLYNSDTTTNQAIRHSDNYGFGIIDAELAVQKALTWTKAPALHLLDTGIRGDIGGAGVVEDPRVPSEVADAEWVEFAPVDGTLGNPAGTGQSGMTIFPNSAGFDFCVRQNVSIESVIVDLTITGDGSNDLYIVLTSPTGTQSILAMPQSLNPFGSADADVFIDDELDQGFGSGVIGTDAYAYYQHPFLTWKHWGEKAGGVWSVRVTDYGPDEATPEGAEPGDDPMTDPGADMLTFLGEMGVPGSEYRSDKTIEAFRIRIYGTDTGLPIFEGCDPLITNCPADLNGDGIINVTDLQIYINWFHESNALADLDSDGDVDFGDLVIYRGLWTPGFCDAGGDPFVGGRPRPGTDGIGSDNDPIINPI